MGRTCNWEDFTGRAELVERLKIHSPLEKESKRWMREEAEGGEDEVRGKDVIMEDP